MNDLPFQEYISTHFPVAASWNTPEEILQMMQENQITFLPMVEDMHYIALLKQDEILKLKAKEEPLSLLDHLDFRPFVFDTIHPYQAAVQISDLNLPILPVIDENEQYVGVFNSMNLLQYFCKETGIGQMGGIIVLAIKPKDYSLSEISRICESNDVIPLNIQIIFHPEIELMDVIIKTNTRELQSLKSTFERYGYHIKEVIGETQKQNNLEDRYRSLMNYINM